jgi:RNA-directed DNA polymerase
MTYAELLQTWCRLLRATPQDVTTLLMRGPYQYKHYQIEKRNGGKRDIFHPTPNLKAVQRWLVKEHLQFLPVHDSVFSYRAGRGIRQHAEAHLHSNFLLRLDFKDFFPSITQDWLLQFLLSSAHEGRLSLDDRAIAACMRVLCRFNKLDGSLALSIGAPSSPAISNAILYAADVDAHAQCAELGCLYTRYADDIYVSARDKGVLTDAERLVKGSFSQHAPRLQFNHGKRINVSKKTHRVVTGLTLTPDRRVSVGRELKRAIKTLVYLHVEGKIDPLERPRLCGLISYVRDVEPAFYNSLVLKFGLDTMETLFRSAPGEVS